MSEKEKGVQGGEATDSTSASTTSIAPIDQPLEDILKRLPTQHREELQKQYEMPEVKVGILSILRYATPLEFALQIVGLLMAIGAGKLTSSFHE